MTITLPSETALAHPLIEAMRLAHRALVPLIDADLLVLPPEALDTHEHRTVLGELEGVLRFARRRYVAEFGAPAIWYGEHPGEETDWTPVVLARDLDDLTDAPPRRRDADGDLWPLDPDEEQFSDSALEEAGRAYRRECEWDFAPGGDGLWLCCYAPTLATGGSSGRPWCWSGNLVGFLILYDRDDDDRYESLAHIWTARLWRRKGVATRLYAEARRAYPLRGIEYPLTDDGQAFLSAHGMT